MCARGPGTVGTALPRRRFWAHIVPSRILGTNRPSPGLRDEPRPEPRLGRVTGGLGCGRSRPRDDRPNHATPVVQDRPRWNTIEGGDMATHRHGSSRKGHRDPSRRQRHPSAPRPDGRVRAVRGQHRRRIELPRAGGRRAGADPICGARRDQGAAGHRGSHGERLEPRHETELAAERVSPTRATSPCCSTTTGGLQSRSCAPPRRRASTSVPVREDPSSCISGTRETCSSTGAGSVRRSGRRSRPGPSIRRRATSRCRHGSRGHRPPQPALSHAPWLASGVDPRFARSCRPLAVSSTLKGRHERRNTLTERGRTPASERPSDRRGGGRVRT